MEKIDKPFTKKDFYKLIICSLIIFSPFFLTKIHTTAFSDIANFFTKVIQFRTEGYPYLNPPIFFSIGEAFSTLAILITVYQFRNEKWKLALKIRSFVLPTIITLISFSIIFSVFSSLFFLNFFQVPQNIFQLSVFWQVISGILMISALIFLFIETRNKNLFSTRRSRKFYETLHWEISRPTDERLNLVLNVLLENFENICKFASSRDSNSEVSRDARAVLDVILSDGSMVKLLSTQRLDGLIYISNVIKKYNINKSHSSKGIPMILRGLFFDSDSFLYKQLDDSGLALSANLYDNLFGSPKILANFDVFGYPTVSFSAKNSTGGATVNVFIQSISKSIETYLKTGEVPARHINAGIEHLSNIFGELCSELSLEKDGAEKTQHGLNSGWWSLHLISHFFGHDYLFIGNRENLNANITKIEKTATEVNFDSSLAINEAIAGALYRGFEQLSRIEKSTDTYHLVLNLLHGMISEPNLREGYITPFEKRIWEQIGKNVLGRYYPMVLKSYLNFIGFCLVGDDGQRKGWVGEQAEKMRRLLYVDLKPQLDTNEKMVDGTLMKDALLPDCMDYKGGKFTYTMGFGRGPEEEISPPPDGAKSALEGIDWQNSRSLI